MDKRIDSRLAIGYGSAWHILRCLGWQRERFSTRIAGDIGASKITWLDFPSYKKNQIFTSLAPIRDAEWTRIDFIRNEQVQEAYNSFWPRGGNQQNWDAIGKATIDGKEEWLLVEAKGHLEEIFYKATEAKECGGRPMIRATFISTIESLGYNNIDASVLAEEWLNGYYQYANRFATLHFFTSQKIAARLVFLYFCGDKWPEPKKCPIDKNGWQEIVKNVHDKLGLKGTSMLEKRVHEVYVNVNLANEEIQD